MKKIVFISDYFADEVIGGAELVDLEVYRYFSGNGYQTEKIHSYDNELIEQSLSHENYYIVSNFTGMSERTKGKLHGYDYSIYEHDHKYLLTRDPSVFQNCKVPPSQIINKSFYENADNVFCQSKKHAEVLRLNLDIDNVVNLGCSLWSEKELITLSELVDRKKDKTVGVMKSKNLVKGEKQSKQYCENNKIDYEIIEPASYSDFMAELSRFEKFVFMPQVLESFSRIAVEARILGCQLVSNNNLGCASESWFRKLKGPELLTFIKQEKHNILEVVEKNTVLKNNLQDVSDMTVILNSYRRPYNLKMQIDAIRNQTVKPKEIWLWINDHDDNRDFDYSELHIDKIFKNDYNWKFYGRFAAALLADTKYIAIFDDDTIPGSKWFENCLDTMHTKEGILGSVGYIQTGPRAQQHEPQRPGWPSLTEKTTQVDYVGHAWFFKREWLSYMWMEMPPTWDNGEDIHLSYTAQKFGNIQTYCPPHPKEDKSKHGSLYGYELGVDDKATSNNIAVSHKEFFTQRDYCIDKSIRSGWKTINGITCERERNDK